MTQAERDKLHTALFTRLLREVKDGSLTDAQKALDMLDGETAAQTLAELMGVEDGIPDEA